VLLRRRVVVRPAEKTVRAVLDHPQDR
jgi:hypothetical protein